MAREFNYEKACKTCNIIYKPTSGHSSYCIACRKSAADKYKECYLSVEFRIKKLLNAARHRALRVKVPFDIDMVFLIELWNKQDGICPISRRKLDLSAWGAKGQVNPNGPSIDRISPKLGYARENVRFVTYHINVAISEYGLEAFLQLCSDSLNNK